MKELGIIRRMGDDFLGLLHYFTLFEALHIEDKSL